MIRTVNLIHCTSGLGNSADGQISGLVKPLYFRNEDFAADRQLH